MTREELTNYVRSTNPKIRETAYKTILTKYTENKGVNWRNLSKYCSKLER